MKMTDFEQNYMETCKEYAKLIPEVVEINRTMNKRKKEIDISTWFQFERTFPAK